MEDGSCVVDRSAAPARCPGRVLNLPPDSIIVEDADEETFDLYTTLTLRPTSTTISKGHSSLGMVDPLLARLTLSLSIPPPRTDASHEVPVAPVRGGRKARSAGGKTKDVEPVELSLELSQDMRRLKGSGGDTSSVLWRTSVHFLKHVLPHLLHPTAPSTTTPLLSLSNLRTATVLELGSGTGALAIALSPFCRSWTASDLPDALSLIVSNLRANQLDPSSESSRIKVEEIDWTTYLPSSLDRPKAPSDPTKLPDLIIATDVLYHPSLIQPLLSTLDFYTEPGRTVVLFIAEFRTEDVVRDWLEEWLEDGGGWEVRRLANVDGEGGWGEGGRFVGWIGWRR